MRTITRGCKFALANLGGGEQIIEFLSFLQRDRERRDMFAAVVRELATYIHVLIDRTQYLNRVLPCVESIDAIAWFEYAIDGFTDPLPYMIEVPGHVYLWPGHKLVFVRRSGGAVMYDTEWPGVQTQEVVRVLIARAAYLRSLLRQHEYRALMHGLRMALYSYEARALRRKRAAANRKKKLHPEMERPRPWRQHPYEDIPFASHGIERMRTSADGHVVV